MPKFSPSVLISNAQVCYRWRQTLQELELQIPLDPCTPHRARDLLIQITQNCLSIQVKATGQSILSGTFYRSVIPDGCTWTIEAGAGGGPLLCVYLEKVDQLQWWATPLQGDPEIDTAEIEPEPSSLADLDPGTRATVEKMMLEQRAKQTKGVH